MIKYFFNFLFILFFTYSLSQENLSDSTIVKSNWNSSGKFTFLGNQSSYSYWTAGGQTSLSGTIKIDYETMETSVPGVFAAGDIVRGASLVVWAIRDGRDAAKGISEYLNKISQNKNKVSNERGKWKEVILNGRTYPLMITFNPSYLIRFPENKKYSWEDLKKLRKIKRITVNRFIELILLKILKIERLGKPN